jgi:16S rRNA (guanine527-N7)-methyltransferase
MLRAPTDPLPSERFEELLRRRAGTFGIVTQAPALAPMAAFLSELDRWRRRINLTGNLSPGQLVDHALEATLASEVIIHGERVVDIGSGGGFPAMPLAILRPDLGMTLVEPRGKRASFLRHVARELGLPNVSVQESRIEEVGGQTFGVATTRAVGSLGSSVGEGAFLSEGGRLLVWTTEPRQLALSLPAFRLEKSIPIPGSNRRVIAVLRKTS